MLTILGFLIDLLLYIVMRLLGRGISDKLAKLFKRKPAKKKRLTNTRVSQVAIVETGKGKYAQEISAWLQTNLRKEFNNRNRDVLIGVEQIDERISSLSQGEHSEVLSSLSGAELVITVGSTATEAYANFRTANTQSRSPPHAFVATTVTQTNELFGKLENRRLKGETAGIHFGLTPHERLIFLKEKFGVKSVLFVAGSNIKADLSDVSTKGTV